MRESETFQAPEEMARRISDAVAALPMTTTRNLIAIAGPPGSGKSTLAELAKRALDEQGQPTGILAMDGFHLDNALLDANGVLARKGAPDTFDVAGFIAMLHRLQREEDVAVPTFDRGLDKAVAASALITSNQRTVLVEGNYLLLDEGPWRSAQGLWTYRVFLDVPMPELEQRLVDRWLAFGMDPVLAKQRALSNDIPNAERVLQRSVRADLILSGHPEA